MSKLKTSSAAKKRFKLTKTGKLLYRGQNARHLKLAKSKTQKRRSKEPKAIYFPFAKKIKRMMVS